MGAISQDTEEKRRSVKPPRIIGWRRPHENRGYGKLREEERRWRGRETTH